ncbi:MAG: GyrI-like domain-containing protein [Gemmatimonadota bacterium]
MSKKKRQSAARRASKKTFGRTAAAPKPAPARKTISGAAEKLDLYKRHKNEYLASLMPSFVRVGPATYLAFDGRGKPGAPDFATGIGAMYNVAFTVKMAYKSAGKDYAVTKLEALWWRDGDSSAPTKDTIWDWRLLIRVPPFVSAAELAKAQDALVAKGKPDDVNRVHLMELHEDTCVQILHVGSYQEEGPTIEKMRRFAEISGRTFSGKHHEIYLSDPSKTAGDKLRTILRQPVA